MNSLITTSQLNMNARANYDKYFDKLKEFTEVDVGSIYYDQDWHVKNLSSSQNVLNPS